jgi:hypothetical protein
MPKQMPDGSIQFTMEEFNQLQQQQSGAPKKQESTSGDTGNWIDKWKSKMTKQPPKQQGQQNQQPPNQQQQQQQPGGPQGLQRDALLEASKKLNFFNPTPEQQKRIAEGDMTAFIEAQQDAMRNLFVDATMTSNNLVEGNSKASKTELERMVAEHVGRLESAKTIRDKTGDFFNAPGGDLMVSALTRQFADANPTANPADIGDMVKGYLTDFSANFGQKETTPNAREVQLKEAQKSATDF